MHPQTPAASVIIPAHDEAKVIDRCLQSLQDSGLPLEVVVAANGCTDDTVARARRHTGVTVLDLPTPSKVQAINAADAVATAFPRIYLDADIVLDRGALAAMVEALQTEEPRAAAPQVHFATRGASWPVRAFYDVFSQLPYVQDKLVGLGVYGMSRAGRARFVTFPDLLGDDLFAQRIFSLDEREIVDGTFEVQVPRTLRQLVKVRTRVARGNAQLAEEDPGAMVDDGRTTDFSTSTRSTSRALVDLLRRRPTLIPAAVVYVLVTAYARRAASRTSPAAQTWERDTSTR
ncbi:glycosyltransferase [Arsenicicoccus sp. oral taxon 190]|uniref:glycosyltransferase n=1 Tax=Arsenicicoccus sp. oral taxon 190 TaxID=1658671 RepID=UPI00067A1834|nr:glycosyltransferase [Arsenicicoccus sp. oral taxon 190]AKT52931.1 hypothetical protein ADJ73_15745 [Arsenicicoccus sp. oral taxon 190]